MPNYVIHSARGRNLEPYVGNNTTNEKQNDRKENQSVGRTD
jgi:hypothetical protein